MEQVRQRRTAIDWAEPPPFKPEAVSKIVHHHDVCLQRHGGKVVFAQSPTPRKVILSLPRVRWLERK